MKPKERDALLGILKARFEANRQRHKSIAWPDVAARLEGNPGALQALSAMESTGGEPDVVGGSEAGHVSFFDCSAETPAGRRNACYDRQARVTRKEHAPKTSAVEMAAAMGIALLTEAQYRSLQALGEFDLKTSSWIDTPADVRALGGALFCDRRYGQVFTYHNGAQSYYAGRGFRGVLRV
jgi:hypothetical protein